MILKGWKTDRGELKKKCQYHDPWNHHNRTKIQKAPAVLKIPVLRHVEPEKYESLLLPQVLQAHSTELDHLLQSTAFLLFCHQEATY